MPNIERIKEKFRKLLLEEYPVPHEPSWYSLILESKTTGTLYVPSTLEKPNRVLSAMNEELIAALTPPQFQPYF